MGTQKANCTPERAPSEYRGPKPMWERDFESAVFEDDAFSSSKGRKREYRRIRKKEKTEKS